MAKWEDADMTAKTLALVGALVLVVGLAATLATVPYVYDHHALDTRGVKTTAEVVKVAGIRKGSTLFTKIVLHFEVDGDEYRAVLETQSKKRIRRAEAKEPFSVVYDPDDPDNNRVPGEPTMHWVLFLSVAPFPLIGLIALLGGWVQLRRERAG
jgi:Protein of unknown function (DUF3592)